jgi:hypothetical protein
MWQTMIRGWIDKFLRRPQEPLATVRVAPVVVKKCPVLDKFRQRYSPEYSPCGEELYCNGMMAEDGNLRIYRDRLTPGCPVVEVHVGSEKIDLRGCQVFKNTHGIQRHPRWAYAQKRVLAPRFGFWVYDPAHPN